MSAISVLHHIADAGWLVLSGSMPTLGDRFPDLADHILDKVDLARGLLILAPTGAIDKGIERFSEEMGILVGAPIPILEIPRQPSMRFGGGFLDHSPGGRRPAEHDRRGAGGVFGPAREQSLVILGGGDVAGWFDSIYENELEAWLLNVLKYEGVVMATAASCANLGSWRFRPGDPGLGSGLGWLPGGVILPGVPDPGTIPQVRDWLSGPEKSYALGLPGGSLLAVGPKGEVEVWGRDAPKIALGKGWAG